VVVVVAVAVALDEMRYPSSRWHALFVKSRGNPLRLPG
jgi:hypothetical protein